MPEQGEALTASTGVLSLSKEIRRSQLTSEIEVRGEDLGAGVWGEMIDRTEQKRKEHGLIVWEGRRSKISDIAEGFDAIEDPETGDVNKHGVDLPSSKFRWIFQNQIAYVHTHLPEYEGTFPSKHRFSKEDIETYIKSGCRVFVMLDGKGVHMLIKSDERNRLDASEVAATAYGKVSRLTQTIDEVRKSIARSLAPYGIRYYFSPNTSPSQDGVVSLKDVRTL